MVVDLERQKVANQLKPSSWFCTRVDAPMPINCANLLNPCCSFCAASFRGTTQAFHTSLEYAWQFAEWTSYTPS